MTILENCRCENCITVIQNASDITLSFYRFLNLFIMQTWLLLKNYWLIF